MIEEEKGWWGKKSLLKGDLKEEIELCFLMSEIR